MSFLTNIFTSIGASSKFQKHRLIFTNKNDLEMPNAKSLKEILVTLSGNDAETRQQIGFATILRKIHNSDSNNSWVYLLKNLIILDSAIQERLFLQQFADLDLPVINEFKEIDKKYIQFYFDGLLRKYFSFMKLKAKCFLRKQSLFRIERYQKQQFLEKLSIEQCQWHIDVTQQLFTIIFQILDYKKYQIAQFKLVQYVFLQFLYKLMNCYSTQLLCITRYLTFLQKLNEKEIIAFRNKVIKFNSFAQNILNFVEQFKWIKGFQTINYKQFDPNKNEILDYIQESLKHRKNIVDDSKLYNIQPLVTQQKITIKKNPTKQSATKEKQQINPRFSFQEQKPSKKKIFQNYINGYSDDFPPKELITYEFIEQNKDQQQDDDRTNLSLFYRSSSISQFNLNLNKQDNSNDTIIEYHPIECKKCENVNIYSSLVSEWII